MTRDHKSNGSSTKKIVGQEILAHAASLLLYPFGLGRSQKPTPRRQAQRTLVFIHGYLGNKSTFLPLRGYLRLHGIKRTLSFSYGANASIEESAQALKVFLRQHVRGGRIDLVCHSLGGIIARIYLQDLGGARRVDRCITLGTPHQGTYSAYWLPTRTGMDLRPDSTLLARVNRNRSAAAKVQFTYVVGASDNIIVPRIFAEDGDDVVVIDQLGHLGMLYSPAVFRAVRERLDPS